MKTIISLLLTASTLFILSCNKPGHPVLKSEIQDVKMQPAIAGDKASNDELLKSRYSDTTSGISLQGFAPGQNPDWDKKIIKTAFLKLEVKDFKGYSDIVHGAAKQYGGYIANEEQNQSNEKKESVI